MKTKLLTTLVLSMLTACSSQPQVHMGQAMLTADELRLQLMQHQYRQQQLREAANAFQAAGQGFNAIFAQPQPVVESVPTQKQITCQNFAGIVRCTQY